MNLCRSYVDRPEKKGISTAQKMDHNEKENKTDEGIILRKSAVNSEVLVEAFILLVAFKALH